MTDLNNTKVQTVVDKVKCLITRHNSDSSSHEDIRVNLAGKANAVHTHNRSDITNVGIVEVVVTYTDESTDTITLLTQNSSS